MSFDQVSFTLEMISSLCSKIYRMAMEAKSNKGRCRTLAQRVKSLEKLVLAMKRTGQHQISSVVKDALDELIYTLLSAEKFMRKYSETKSVMNFLKSSAHQDKFHNFNEKITVNFQVLQGAMQIEQGDIVNQIYNTVAEHSTQSTPNITPATTVTNAVTTAVTTPAIPATPVPCCSPVTSSIPTVPMVNPMMPMVSPGNVCFFSNGTYMLYPGSQSCISYSPTHNYVGQTFSPLQFRSNMAFAQSFTPMPTVVTNQISYTIQR